MNIVDIHHIVLGLIFLSGIGSILFVLGLFAFITLQ